MSIAVAHEGRQLLPRHRAFLEGAHEGAGGLMRRGCLDIAFAAERIREILNERGMTPGRDRLLVAEFADVWMRAPRGHEDVFRAALGGAAAAAAAGVTGYLDVMVDLPPAKEIARRSSALLWMYLASAQATERLLALGLEPHDNDMDRALSVGDSRVIELLIDHGLRLIPGGYVADPSHDAALTARRRALHDEGVMHQSLKERPAPRPQRVAGL